MARQLRQRGVENVAADIIEVDIDALGAVFLQSLLHVAGFVVDRSVEAELVDQVAALVRAAGNADRAAALDFRDLSDDGADGAGRAGYDNGLSGLRLAYFEQAEIGGQSRHSQRAEEDRQRGDASVGPDELFAGHDRVLLHPEHAGHLVADLELRMTRRDHPAGGTGAHYLADAHRRDVRLAFVHPAAHRRVERNVEHLDQYFAVDGLRHGFFGDVPVAAFGEADGSRRKAELTIDCLHVTSVG